MTVEVNYSDPWGAPYITPETRRYSQLAQLLRSRTLVDVDCWSRVPGSPIPPGMIEEELRRRIAGMQGPGGLA
jgi:2-oxoglutarate ferredoxin oxidoreductase subunit alpha